MKQRGLVYKVTETPGGGFGQVFPAPNRKGTPVAIDLLVDPTKLKTAGSRAFAELDSPFVPIGGVFDAFVIFVVQRQDNGSLVAFTSIPNQSVGTPLVLPAGHAGHHGHASPTRTAAWTWRPAPATPPGR